MHTPLPVRYAICVQCVSYREGYADVGGGEPALSKVRNPFKPGYLPLNGSNNPGAKRRI